MNFELSSMTTWPAGMKKSVVELGFLEGVEDAEEATSSLCLPSKVGGKPSWLDLKRVPSSETLSCVSCKKPMICLLQFHAPLHPHLQADAEDQETRSQTDKKDQLMHSQTKADTEDHRTLFIFMCRDPNCHSSGNSVSFMALRWQDCKDSSEPENNSCDLISPLCIVCGGRGSKWCGSCHLVNYCSREHQIHDWKSGHKRMCSELAGGKPLDSIRYNPSVGVVLPELDIVTEPEPEMCWKAQYEKSEEERMEEYQRYLKNEGSTLGGSEFNQELLERAAVGDTKTDKIFRAFKKRTAIEPQQVSSCEFIYRHSVHVYYC